MKTKISTLIVLFLISVGLSAQIDRTKQPEPGPAPKIQLQTPTEYKLDNGLTVLVVENHKLPRVSYSLRIDNLPSLDGDKAGISSILAAMLGDGTASISKDDFNEEVDFLGANLNFGSSGGFASGLSKYSERILELMADAAINPLLTEEEFLKQKDILIEGLKSNEKNVDAVAGRVEAALVYGTHHPNGEYITEETVNNITLDNVRAYYQKRFNPENAYLVVIGDIDNNSLKGQIKQNFGSWKSAGVTESSVPDASPNVQFTQINFVDMPNAVQSNISVTNNVQLKMNDQDYHAALITNYILGGGSSAYLFSNLRETHGYTYGSYSSLQASRFIGRFAASAKVRNEVTDSSIVEIQKEIKRIRTELVDPDALARAKANYTGNFVRAIEQPQTVANYAFNIKLNELPSNFYETYLQKINAVTPEDVIRVANKYFLADNARIVVVGKGSDVLENLEKTGIPVKYFDKFANPVPKPEFSKPIPEGVTAESVISDYIVAIGGKEKALTVKTVHATADVTIEGAPFKPKAEIKQMAPNKESMEMSIEGMGTIMKQKFNGESGYIEQQGQKNPMPDEMLERQKVSKSIIPELHYADGYNTSLKSLTTIDGNNVYKVKVEKNGESTIRYYNADTKLLVRVETTVEQGGQEIHQIVDFDKYSEVNGVKFPYYQIIKSGPQTLIFNFGIIKVNEGVSDEDFN